MWKLVQLWIQFFNPLLIGLERCFKNGEKAENPLSSQVNAAWIFSFLNPEIDAGADEKQDIYFYMPKICYFMLDFQYVPFWLFLWADIC